MMKIDQRLYDLILSLGEGGHFPSERELAVSMGVSRADLRKELAEFEARGVLIRKRRTGTVVAAGALESLKTPIYVGRKDLAEMAGDTRRLLKNTLWRQLEDEIAGKAAGYRLESKAYVADPIRLRTQGRPTIFGCGAASLPHIGSYGLCEDLTERVRDWAAAPSLWPNLWESVSEHGRIMALPVQAHVFLLFGNLARMRECGLNPAEPPRTWSELTEFSRRMTDPRTRQYGLALPEDRHLAWGFMDFMYQAGGKVIDASGLSWVPSFHHPPGVKAVTFLKDLRWKHQVLLPNAGDSASVAKAFFEGRAGLCVMETEDMFNHVLGQGWGEQEVGVWALPAGPEGHDLCHVSVSAVFINAYASAKEKAAAWQHLTALWSREQVMRHSRTFWQHGVATDWPSIFRNATAQETGVGLPPAWFRTAQGCLARALPEPSGAGWNPDIYLKPVLQRMLEDPNADPQRELERAAASAQPGLGLN